jgi:hypothetical protein
MNIKIRANKEQLASHDLWHTGQVTAGPDQCAKYATENKVYQGYNT